MVERQLPKLHTGARFPSPVGFPAGTPARDPSELDVESWTLSVESLLLISKKRSRRPLRDPQFKPFNIRQLIRGAADKSPQPNRRWIKLGTSRIKHELLVHTYIHWWGDSEQ